jgi:hypothetical protein
MGPRRLCLRQDWFGALNGLRKSADPALDELNLAIDKQRTISTVTVVGLGGDSAAAVAAD